jgi:hypothetical protein
MFDWSEWQPLVPAPATGTDEESSSDPAVSPGAAVGPQLSEVLVYDAGRQPLVVLVASTLRDTGGWELVLHVSTWILNCSNQVGGWVDHCVCVLGAFVCKASHLL